MTRQRADAGKQAQGAGIGVATAFCLLLPVLRANSQARLFAKLFTINSLTAFQSLKLV